MIDNPLVSVQWLNEHLDNPNLVVLDGTINKTFDANLQQIPKARFFDIKLKFSDISGEFPSTFPSQEQFQEEARKLGINKNSTIVVYDDKGIYSSARVWWLFRAFGHFNVAVLDGGFPEWIKSGYPTEIMSGFKGETGDFEAKLQQGYMVFFEDVQKASAGKSHTIVDARSSGRFNGEVPEPRAGLRSGTIPNSMNLPFTDLLMHGVFKSEDDVKTLFAKVIETKDTPTIFSCGSGITACVLALGAEMSGYQNISVYDGSWTEWGSLVKE
ncbi:sulfurtransferase [Seonamhaeicola aphaedonensis]|uniref:Thiosulfate/3-mercaptopyruvate sulfurtransferase n=1 Tax=Seonamhaeicola aphaedonensis TaxID=1461338 RepID=A0A3D9HIX7_9FLAO|nr:sulfurtransferase [Seonamhaeicola aphaedonensis]RED49413.1 thiosulfate/3-mercaptopyruvate sulfurtransferase [Seonamhaeicola aphaedonensis]